MVKTCGGGQTLIGGAARSLRRTKVSPPLRLGAPPLSIVTTARTTFVGKDAEGVWTRSESPVSVMTPRTGLRHEIELARCAKLDLSAPASPPSAAAPVTPPNVEARRSTPLYATVPEQQSTPVYSSVPRSVATFCGTPGASAGRTFAIFSPASACPTSGGALRAVLRKRIAHTLWSSPTLCTQYGISMDSAEFLRSVDAAAASVEEVLWSNPRLHASVSAMSSAALSSEMGHAVEKLEAAEAIATFAAQ